MTHYSTLADDFYINLNLNTELDLPQARETILGYFERVQKSYPEMRNFYARERGEYVLEEDKDRGDYRWTSVEARRICSGCVNPTSVDDAMNQHRLVLELAPYLLSVSPLDCETLNIMYGFDFNYRGNHNQLVAEALGISPALERMLDIPGASILGVEPTLHLALDANCRVQCRLNIETRTTAYHVRTREFSEEQLSVYFTVRRYGSLEAGETLLAEFDRLAVICQDIVDNYLIENVLRPLHQAIAAK